MENEKFPSLFRANVLGYCGGVVGGSLFFKIFSALCMRSNVAGWAEEKKNQKFISDSP